jgi:hypothetical protein
MKIQRTFRAIRPNVDALQKLCDDFNSRHHVGTLVSYQEVIGVEPAETAETRSAAWVMGEHTAVVLLNGKAGAVALSHVEVLP